MKSFKHTLVPVVELTSETTEQGRYYTIPTGEKLPSVTTLLGRKLDKSGLDEWRARVGEAEAARVGAVAARRGTAVHAMAEKFVLNEPHPTKGHMPINVEMFNSIKPILLRHVDDILGIELPLYNTTLGVAGRTDLVAHWDGVPSIIDYKTSSRVKEESWIETYFLQSTIYSMMFEWTYRIKVPQIVIVIAVDSDFPQVFIKDRGDYVGRVLEITGND
jgi:hypothetical protein